MAAWQASLEHSDCIGMSAARLQEASPGAVEERVILSNAALREFREEILALGELNPKKR
jgi:hypothetical protein